MKSIFAAVILSISPVVAVAQDWLQQEQDLAALYLPTGVVDGEIDEKTNDAIKLFQYSFGFPMKNRLSPEERSTLARAARAAASMTPFVFEERREQWQNREALFLNGAFNRFERTVFANGPHFMAQRTATPFHPENLNDPNNLFSINTERVNAYTEQALAIAAAAQTPLAPAVFTLTTYLREDAALKQTLAALDTILPIAESNPSETAMTALFTVASRARFLRDVSCRDWPQADRLANILNRAVVVASQSNLEPYQWSALVLRAIDCSAADARDGLYQLRYDHSLGVSDFARREVLLDWARDAMAREQDEQAIRAYREAMDLGDARPFADGIGQGQQQGAAVLIPPQDGVAMWQLGLKDAALVLAKKHVDQVVGRNATGANLNNGQRRIQLREDLNIALMLLELGDAGLLNRLGWALTPAGDGSDPTTLRGDWRAAQNGMRGLMVTEEYSRLVRVGRQILPDIAASNDQSALLMVNLLVAEASSLYGDFELAESHLTDVQRIAAILNQRAMIETRLTEVQKRLSVFRLESLPVAERVVQQLTTYYGEDCKGAPHREGAKDWPYPKIDFANFSNTPTFRNTLLESDVMERMIRCVPSETRNSIKIRKLPKHQARAFCSIAAIHGRADLVTSVLHAKDAAVPDLTASTWCIYGLTDVGLLSWKNRASWAPGRSDPEMLYNLMIATPQERRNFFAGITPKNMAGIEAGRAPWDQLGLDRPPLLRKKLLDQFRQSYLADFGNIGPQEENYRDAYLAGIALRKLGLYKLSEAVFYLDDRINPFRFGMETGAELREDLLDIRSVQKRLDYALLYRASHQYDRARAAIGPVVELAVERLSSTEDPLPGTVEQWSERLAEAFRVYLTLQFDPGNQQPNYHSIFLVQQFIQAAQSTASLSVLEQRLNSSVPAAARDFQDTRRIVRAVMQDPNAQPRAIEEATQRFRAAQEALNAGDAALQGHQIGVIRPLKDALKSLAAGEVMLVVTQLDDAVIQTVLTSSTAQARRLDLFRYEAVSQVRRFRDSITQSTAKTDRFDTRNARELYDFMLGWALGRVVPQRLKVVADSPWATLPFGALKTGDGWLAQTTALQLSPSVARSVADGDPKSTPKTRAKRGFIGVGDPILKNYAQRPGVTALAGLAALPETKAELDYLALSFRGNPARDVFTQTNATESKIRALNAENRFQDSRVLALATHGLLSRDAAGVGDAALVLSDPIGPNEDGFLSASEIYTYRIGAELVILSACNTGTPNAANGLSDLASAFFYAGAGRLMLTHWEIESGAAVELMKQFAIDFRTPGAAPADSLRLAVAAILANPQLSRFHHPRFWASHFVMS